MTRRQMLTALFGAAVLALPVAGCGHQPVQDEQGAELILRYAENQPEDYPTTQAALAFADLGKGSLLARIGERDSANIYLWHMLLRNFAALAFLMAGVYETMACQLLMPFLVGAASTALAELMYRRKKKGV